MKLKCKAIVCFFTLSVMVSALLSVSASTNNRIALCPADILHGDANDDGVIIICDVTALQSRIAGINAHAFYDVPEQWLQSILDINKTGNVDVTDATAIQRYLVGIDSELYNDIGSVEFTAAQRLLQSTSDIPNSESFVFNSVQPEVDSYLSTPDAKVTDYCNGSGLDRSAAYTIAVPANTSSVYILDTFDGNGWKDTVTSGIYRINNLIPNHIYRYLAVDPQNVLLKIGQCSVSGSVRMIDAEGDTFNIRDLGGWSCDGGAIRYGMIYRGCELNGSHYNISLNDQQRHIFLDKLGIQDEIDLRSKGEVSGADGRYGTCDDTASFDANGALDYTLFPVRPYEIGVNLEDPEQTNLYASVIKRIANDVNNNKPIYIHCLAGADRTGTVCALIEAICGVSFSDIEHDYELTSFASNHTRIRQNTSWRAFTDRIVSMNGNTFRDKAVSYALSAGVSIEEINALRCALIDGNPEIIVR